MKCYLCAALLTVLAIPAFAQEKTDTLGEAAAMDTAGYYYGRSERKAAASSTVNRDPIVFRKAFRVNSAKTAAEVYDRALGFARMINTNYRANAKQHTIHIPVTWSYKGGFNECIEDVAFNGRLTVEVKGNKTRLSLANIEYAHHNRDDGRDAGVAKTDFFTRHPDCAPAKGKAELLYNCTECRRSLNSIDRNLQAEFETLAGQYQEWLKKY